MIALGACGRYRPQSRVKSYAGAERLNRRRTKLPANKSPKPKIAKVALPGSGTVVGVEVPTNPVVVALHPLAG